MIDPIRGQAERLDVTLGERFGELRGATDLRGTDRREVAGMAEKEYPVVADSVIKIDDTSRGIRSEIRRNVADMNTHDCLLSGHTRLGD
ncbi:hypothetical protein [Pararhizobium antarcticum]|uniref:Uncharacterized protein n=1 Tax=Pararhizobium antarcticum TaxID=1798805 RepID=A0A657LVJ6_9HYPH|nr:hypothetical protein [Pararhizobium antarcticum]OJF95674.1 hypothetical protein AX761_17185 [Rhizobium sp. 58]OJF99422.1 hypothetical protein AX760_13135 [Pararhizobium antarcticum]